MSRQRLGTWLPNSAASSIATVAPMDEPNKYTGRSGKWVNNWRNCST